MGWADRPPAESRPVRHELPAIGMMLIALGVVGFLAVFQRHEAASGALISVLSAAAIYFLTKPKTGGVKE